MARALVGLADFFANYLPPEARPASYLLASKGNDIVALEVERMIPPFRRNGTLPPGIHWATWEEVVQRFGTNAHRQALLVGFRAVLDNLRQAGCQEVYLDGSFVTDKAGPQDFDGCWSKVGVDPDKLDPVLLDFSQDRAAQKAKYGGEMFIAQAPANEQHVFLGFFQRDRRNQHKGIIGIKLSEELL